MAMKYTVVVMKSYATTIEIEAESEEAVYLMESKSKIITSTANKVRTWDLLDGYDIIDVRPSPGRVPLE